MPTLLVICYFVVLLLLCAYGAHRAHLVYLCHRHQHALARVTRESEPVGKQLPRVTIQLPLYNEATVVRRLLRATANIDYPRELLEIQVLDDSTDETRQIAQDVVEELRGSGIDIHYLRRPDRVGYKAGALDFGLGLAKGELIAVFDADFIPQPEFLLKVVGNFSDPAIGMVQTRWGHLNRDLALITRVQALMLDGHHLVENRARFASGRLFNFSGTGGIWRRTAIDDAGGWEHDTLTEDLDLSYRAQLKGWRFVYRPDVMTPSELPEEMSALRAQQYRWAKGTVQCARKLLSRVLTADLTVGQRVEAFFHMTPHFAYPLMLLLTILLPAALFVVPAADVQTMLLIDLPLVFGATGSLAAFYSAAEHAQGRSRWGAVKHLPALIGLGAGLAPHLTKAVWEGMNEMAGEFVRTPKRGATAGRYFQTSQLPLIEIGLGCLSAFSVVTALRTGHWFALPFAGLFTWGYFAVAYHVATEQLRSGRRVLAMPERAESVSA